MVGFTIKWLGMVTVVLVLVILPVMALLVRGEDAVWGVTWGLQEKLCELKIKNCELPPLTVNWGMYDYDEVLQTHTKIAVDHIYVKWNTEDVNGLLGELERSINRNRWPLVTVEPFVEAGKAPETLLADVAKGEYDSQMEMICSQVGELGQPVFLRWGHEMEQVTGRYPWATESADEYVSAYRRMVDVCRILAKDVYYVWSPAGNSGLEAYWPGSEYADYVGVSVYGFPEWEKETFGKIRSFEENFGEKYDRVNKFARPVMIAELGVVGDWEYKRAWLREARKGFGKFPELKTVVYFNAVDSPEAWGPEYPVPDWRIDQKLFDEVAT